MTAPFMKLGQDIVNSASSSDMIKKAELTNVSRTGGQVRLTNANGHVEIIPLNAKGDLNPQATWADARLSVYEVSLVPTLSRKDLNPKTLQRLNKGYHAS